MNNAIRSYAIDTTIFAWATLHRGGGRAILRISGPDTWKYINKIFSPDKSPTSFSPENYPHQAIAGMLNFDNDLKCRCWCWIFAKPNSYTGQNMAEIHLPSSLPLMKLIDQRLLKLELTPASPGEFTARAFLLGKMDLTQAQAVGQLVNAQNDAQIEAAINMLEGKLHRWLSESFEKLAQLATLLEANIDFSEEEIESITLEKLKADLKKLQKTIANILNQAIDSRSLDSLPKVFLAGPANAGKSTLLNKLTGLDRAICSPLAGTTRDVLSAPWQFHDREVLLCDTAGLLCESEDKITKTAIERSKQYLKLADLIIFLFDASAEIGPQLKNFADVEFYNDSKKIITVLNKIDIATSAQIEHRINEVKTKYNQTEILAISAQADKNLSAFSQRVFGALETITLTTSAGQIALDLRGRDALQTTLSNLERAVQNIQTLSEPGNFLGLEIIAVDIQQAMRSLGALLGKDVTENVLENIFSRFCIGK